MQLITSDTTRPHQRKPNHETHAPENLAAHHSITPSLQYSNTPFGSKCCTWIENVAPGRCDVAPGKRRRPLILLVCSNVAPGKPVFGGAGGGTLNVTESLNPSNPLE